MRHFSRRLSLLLLLSLPALPALAADTHEHHQHHGAHAQTASLHLNQGRPWQTDAPLRQGMERIRQLMAEKLVIIQRDQLAAADYRSLATRVDGEVGKIVSTCKLPAEADAMLHLVIADLGEGSEAMAGKHRDMSPRRGAAKVVGALENYGRYFDHPGWKSLGH